VSAAPPGLTAGAVYDRGYRPYEGPRGSERSSTLALWRLSVRRALGLRRSWRQKVLPWTLLAIATLPAIINVGVAYVLKRNPDPTDFGDFQFITYREYVGVSTTLLLFVALTAPDVVCPDRAHRVLPLLFSRPLTGADYVLAKVGAIAFILFGFGFLPQVVLFVGQMVVSDGALHYFTGHADVLWKVPVAVALLSVYYAAIGVALSSLTDRRIVGGVAILGTALVTSVVANILVAVTGGRDETGSALAVLNVLSLPLQLRDLVFLGHIGHESKLSGVAGGGVLAVATYVLVLGTAIAVLLHRYREVDL
jgi:ABC-2 type transport system permease protein